MLKFCSRNCAMSQGRSVRRNLDQLEILSLSTTSVIKQTLRMVDDSLFVALREIIYNTLNGPVQLSPVEKKALVPYRKQLYKIVDNVDDTGRATLKVLGHKFLPTLLPPALKVLKKWLNGMR